MDIQDALKTGVPKKDVIENFKKKKNTIRKSKKIIGW